MILPRSVLFVAACLFTLPACAQWNGSVGVGLRMLRVSEFDPSGTRLVREQGALPGIEAGLNYQGEGWQAFGELERYQAGIAYRGQSSLGQPLSSTTSTALSQLRVGAIASVTARSALLAAIETEHWRRDIGSSGAVLGLQENTRSNRLLFGFQYLWNPSAGFTTQALLVVAAPEHLQVAFSGALDATSLTTRSGVGVRLLADYQLLAAPHIQLHAGIDYLDVKASAPADVTRQGTLAGSITQPAHSKTALTASVRYRF